MSEIQENSAQVSFELSASSPADAPYLARTSPDVVKVEEKPSATIEDGIIRSDGDNGTIVAAPGTFIADNPDRPYPTEEEMETLRIVADRIPFSAFFVVVVEAAERFSFYGLSGVFTNYIQRPLPEGGSGTGAPGDGPGTQAGALDKGQGVANGLYNMFSFLAYLTPILGGILADSRWGRYKTILVFSFVYMIGLLIVTLTSIPSSLRNGGGLPGWIVGAIIVATGTGGIKSNVGPMLGEQYSQTTMYVKTLPSGEKVIVSPTVTITRLFNMFYFAINIGALGGIATTEAELHVGFWLAYLLPTIVFVIVPIVLILGRKGYIITPPRGSVVLETGRVLRIALRGFWRNPIEYIKNARRTSIFERAKPTYYLNHNVDFKEKSEGATTPKWITWDDAFVDETKRTIKACAVFAFYPLYWITYNQLTTNLISQAGTMRTDGVPNDLVNNFDPIALIIFVPITDIFVYPGLRKIGFNPKPIQKITFGFFLGSLAMVYAAVLQHYIYQESPLGEYADEDNVADISVWIQVPAYVLIAFSEIFAVIPGYEYAYNKAPQRMKGLVTALFLLMTAIGNALNIALSPVSQNPHLVWMYSGVAITAFIAGIVFYFTFRHRDYTEELDNQIGKGRNMSEVALVDNEKHSS